MKRAVSDKRSQRIVVVSHCILNVHSLEDNLALYPGLEEEFIELLIKKGVGLYQIPCPEIELSGIFRKALPKESYDHSNVRSIKKCKETLISLKKCNFSSNSFLY
jgi:predicted secreted protein